MQLPKQYQEPAGELAAQGIGRGLDTALGGGEDRLSFARFVKLLNRRYRLFIGCVCAILVMGILITMMQTKIYQATATVLLKNSGKQLEEKVTDDADKQSMSGESDVTTEIQVIGSLDLARRVVRSLNLVENTTFNPYLAPTSSVFGSSGAKPLDIKTLTPEQRQEMEDSVARMVRGGLNASRIGTAYSVAISYEHRDPRLAAQIANAYAREYTRAQLNNKTDATAQATEFLAKKVAELREQATEDFAAVQNYRIANGLLSNSATSLTEQDISVYNQQTASARAEAAADQARLDTARRQLSNGSKGDDVGEALSSSVVSSLRTQRAQIEARVADLSARYGDRYPDLIRARQELAAVDGQIQEEINRVISNLEAKAAVSAQRVGSLNASLGSAKGELARNNGALVTLADLQKRADASQGLYESYLARYRELMASSGTEQPEARVLTEAVPPSSPSSPKVMLNLILAGMVGIVVGLIAALAAEMQYRGLTTAQDVEKRVGLPFLGLTPDNASLEHHADNPLETLTELPDSVLAEAVRGIYAATHIPIHHRGTVLAVSSALPGEGKTMLSAMLGQTAHAMGTRVVVVDCDIMLHGLSSLTRFREGPGLREVAATQCTLDRALRRWDGDGFAVLPITSKAEAGERLTSSGAIQAIVAQLKERFDLVILDCPPLLAIAEAREIAGLADGVILAAQWRKTADDAVRSAARLLPARLADYTGVVLSRVDLRKQSRYAEDDSSPYTASYQRYVAAAAT